MSRLSLSGNVMAILRPDMESSESGKHKLDYLRRQQNICNVKLDVAIVWVSRRRRAELAAL